MTPLGPSLCPALHTSRPGDGRASLEAWSPSASEQELGVQREDLRGRNKGLLSEACSFRERFMKTDQQWLLREALAASLPSTCSLVALGTILAPPAPTSLWVCVESEPSPSCSAPRILQCWLNISQHHLYWEPPSRRAARVAPTPNFRFQIP